MCAPHCINGQEREEGEEVLGGGRERGEGEGGGRGGEKREENYNFPP